MDKRVVEPRRDHRAGLRTVLALLLAAGCVGFVLWHAPAVSPATVEPSVGSDAAHAPSPQDTGSASAERSSAVPSLPVRFSGLILWEDGEPVVGASVSIAGVVALTDARGNYQLTLEPRVADGAKLEIAVTPRCWTEPETRQVAVAPDPEPGGWRCDPVRLPNVIDLVVNVRIVTAVAAALASGGFGRLQLVATDARKEVDLQPAGLAEVPLADGDAVMRVKYVPAVRIGAAAVQSREWARTQWLQQHWIMPLTRDDVTSIEVRLSSDQMLRGIVLDHEGRCIPRARVEVIEPSPLTATGESPTLLVASDDGEFVYLGAPGTVVQVTASHVGATAGRQSVRVGEICYLTVDLSKHARIRVTSGGAIVDRFECGKHPSLFGRHEDPDLTPRATGTCWLPETNTEERLFLTWPESGRVYEQQLALEKSEPDRVIEIDAGRLSKLATHEVRIEADVGDLGRWRFTLTLVDPLSALPKGSRQKGFFSTRVPHRLLGVPTGRYQVRLEGQNGDELAKSTIDVSGDTVVSLRNLMGR